MDFFEAQDAARRRTGMLIGFFAAAVLAIIAIVYLVAHIALGAEGTGVDPTLLLQVALGVGGLVGIGAAMRSAGLRRGGPAVAELLGGRRVAVDTTDPEERVLVNVVEEMALASGTPVPAIYVLDREDSINAFAAGYAIHDAAVAVTRGTLRSLTRDELQGVIAHEFSHILNGDMRLNVRLIGVLYGILLLSVVGRGILYAGPRGRRGGRDGGAGAILLLGIALLIVGYVGVFFGKLIKAAVSRQREYLADSAAVQFTRNPAGLAGALKKIGEDAYGSRIEDPHAEELSHLFFASGVSSTLFGFLATHPPLEERIRRLDPSWSGEYGARERPASTRTEHARAAAKHGFEPGMVAGIAAAIAADRAVASVGTPGAEHLAHAGAMLERFPRDLLDAAHSPAGAPALVFALVMANGARVNDAHRAALRSYGGIELEARVKQLAEHIRNESPGELLELLDLTLPALQHLSPGEAERLREAVRGVVQADGRVRMFEFALLHILARRLETASARPDRAGRRYRSFRPLREDVEVILSAVARSGNPDDPAAAEAAFEAGRRRLPDEAGSLRLRDASDLGLARLDDALSRLEHARPALQRTFLEACAAAAAHDEQIHRNEAALLRAISESLNCPMPPLLAAVGAPSS
jgi:Zn-dependent protease with chaperone function